MKFLRHVFLITAISILLTTFVFAEPVDLNTDNTEQIQMEAEYEMSSISNPTQAYLAVNSNSYSAPDPYIGVLQETVPANTNIWVVEKVYCESTETYYYYAGYTYNSQSHRGYFNENDVYKDGAKLDRFKISYETEPAEYKVHTSLPGTVYDGPGTSYSVMGSVEQESIKLIRTESDYNFIEYTVTATGKRKKGYLHYSKITGSWPNLTAQIATELNGKVFYVRNSYSGKYLDVKTWSTSENGRLQQYTFNGDPNQIFRFTYNSAGKYFTIQPANNYMSGRRLSINLASNTQHEERHLCIQTPAEVSNQRFWIVGITLPDGVSKEYKILPLSSYGTMTITNCSDYVNQYYTSPYDTVDAWVMESTSAETNAKYCSQGDKNWCWAASGYSLASAEPGFMHMELSDAIQAVRRNNYNDGGTVSDRAEIANYFLTRRKYSGDFVPHHDKIYTSSVLRRFIKDGHAMGVSLFIPEEAGQNAAGHALTIFKFEWIDKQSGEGAPGHYNFYYYDSDKHEYYNPLTAEYGEFAQTGVGTKGGTGYWDDSVAYNTSYNSSTIDAYH